LGALLPDENAVAFVLDVPDCQRIQRRGTGGFAAAQIETGVMPGTTDALAVDEALGQRTMIMAAMGVDGKNLRPERTSNTSSSPTWPSSVAPENSDGAIPCDRSGPAGAAC